MAFSSSTSAALAHYNKTVRYSFELKTNHSGADSWQEYALADFALTRDSERPAQLRAELAAGSSANASESDPLSRVQLFAQARLTAHVGSESAVLFSGRVARVLPADHRLTLECHGWEALLADCECELDLAPDETAEITPARQVSLTAGGAFGSVFGFSYSGAGDPAFDATGSRRRSWMPAGVQLWRDAAAMDEVPPAHYQIDWAGGVVTVLEDTSGRSYYATGVRCAIEGTLDFAAVVAAALKYPAADGGPGLSPAELDLPPTGIDAAGPVYFRGRVADFLRQLAAQQQANLRLWYAPDSGCFTLRVVEQQPAGSEDWALLHPRRIAQPRELRDVYTRIVATGLTERPLNALNDPAVTLTNDRAALSGDWFAWDGLAIGPDSTFAVVSPHLHDGDHQQTSAVHNLPASENGGSTRYDSWYSFVTVDLGAVANLERLRLTLPPSRNLNAQAGHQGQFWPGLRVLGSVDGSDYRLLAPGLSGRFAPGEQLDLTGEALTMRRARYVRIELGAYKHGLSNDSDPSIGLGELAIYTSAEYRVVRAIDGSDPLAEYQWTDGTTWSRYHPLLAERLGGRHRTLNIDLSGKFNEYLAADYALDLLAESVRLFARVEYTAVCDPRIRLYDTVSVDDELNGGAGAILVERITLTPAGTVVGGTDYRAEALGDGS